MKNLFTYLAFLALCRPGLDRPGRKRFYMRKLLMRFAPNFSGLRRRLFGGLKLKLLHFAVETEGRSPNFRGSPAELVCSLKVLRRCPEGAQEVPRRCCSIYWLTVHVRLGTLPVGEREAKRSPASSANRVLIEVSSKYHP